MSSTNGFEMYFEGFLVQAREHFKNILGHYSIPMIDETGAFTEFGVETLCMSYSLDKKWNAALFMVSNGMIDDLPPDDRTMLFNCSLIDTDGELTTNGHYKLIESLPLSEQVNRLGISYEELVLPKKDNVKVEELVRRCYENNGFQCFADEGFIFKLLIGCSLANELNVLAGHYPFELEDPVIRGLDLLQFTTRDSGVFPGFWDEACKTAIIQIIDKTTNERITRGLEIMRRAGGPYFPKGAECGDYSAEGLIAFYSILGRQGLLDISRFLLDSVLYGAGWPDITAYKDGKIKLIEVKKSDKLRFSQIRTIYSLRSELESSAPEIQVTKVKLN